jgi:hypothetical protein
MGASAFGGVAALPSDALAKVVGLDRHNAGIADIGLVPSNAQGLVEAKSEVEILRPTDPARGSDKLFYDVLNRGRKAALPLFNDSPGKDDLAEPANIGNGFLMERGYTVIWAGWQRQIRARHQPEDCPGRLA